jgi:hypothetical protein
MYGTYIKKGTRKGECWLSTQRSTRKHNCGVSCQSFVNSAGGANCPG